MWSTSTIEDTCEILDRLYEGKDYFTIYDFCKNYEMFNDPEWDGEPIEPEERPKRPKGEGGDEGGEDETPVIGDPEPPKATLEIKLADGTKRRIQHMASTSFWGPDGKPISPGDFIKKLFGELPDLFRDEDELRKLWGQPDTRKALMQGLSERGYGEDELKEVAKIIEAEKSDLFDVLAYIAYAMEPITRQDRVNAHKEKILKNYDDKLQAFLEFVLGQYERQGVGELDQSKLPSLLELRYQSTADAANQLGGIQNIKNAFVGFQKHLYE